MPEESEIEIRQVFEAEDFGPAQSESEHKAFMDECFAYHDELRKNGHIVGGEALQIARNAITLGTPAWTLPISMLFPSRGRWQVDPDHERASVRL